MAAVAVSTQNLQQQNMSYYSCGIFWQDTPSPLMPGRLSVPATACFTQSFRVSIEIDCPHTVWTVTEWLFSTTKSLSFMPWSLSTISSPTLLSQVFTSSTLCTSRSQILHCQSPQFFCSSHGVSAPVYSAHSLPALEVVAWQPRCFSTAPYHLRRHRFQAWMSSRPFCHTWSCVYFHFCMHNRLNYPMTCLACCLIA